MSASEGKTETQEKRLLLSVVQLQKLKTTGKTVTFRCLSTSEARKEERGSREDLHQFWTRKWIMNMYRGGRKLQRGVASVLNKKCIRIMYWGGRKPQRGFPLVLSRESNGEYALGRK